MEAIALFLAIYSGSGNGNGYSYGEGNGNGNGYCNGNGYGNGSGNGYGSGDGEGNGNGYGYGYGDGEGNGYGLGDGEGNGYGIKSINGNNVHRIDDLQTVIYSAKGNVARGAILNGDLTLSPCYVFRVDNCFAHGETVKKAYQDALNKAIQAKPIEERIASFLAEMSKGKHPASKWGEWHGIITGSCSMGRSNFMANNEINPSDLFDLAEFFEKTKNQYGSEIIKQIKP
jgi:hypothetical protein